MVPRATATCSRFRPDGGRPHGARPERATVACYGSCGGNSSRARQGRERSERVPHPGDQVTGEDYLVPVPVWRPSSLIWHMPMVSICEWQHCQTRCVAVSGTAAAEARQAGRRCMASGWTGAPRSNESHRRTVEVPHAAASQSPHLMELASRSDMIFCRSAVPRSGSHSQDPYR